jgi:hypothetical protein
LKYFTFPFQGIWQWLVLNNTKPTHLKGKSEFKLQGLFFITKQHQIFLPNQISLPKQWWRPIHHQSNNQNPDTYGNEIFLIAICVVTKTLIANTANHTHTHANTNIYTYLKSSPSPLGS